eukprot:c32832_g1_i1 orf=3-224(-)
MAAYASPAILQRFSPFCISEPVKLPLLGGYSTSDFSPFLYERASVAGCAVRRISASLARKPDPVGSASSTRTHT